MRHPDISIVKTAGDAPDGDVLEVQPGDQVIFHFHYEVCKTGETNLTNGEVTDDNGTPGDMSDDVTVTFTGPPGDRVDVHSDPIAIGDPPVCGELLTNVGRIVASDPDGTMVHR